MKAVSIDSIIEDNSILMDEIRKNRENFWKNIESIQNRKK
jgi:hypothetical protein